MAAGFCFLTAFLQLTIFYYLGGCLLQFVLPCLLSLKSVQTKPRPSGQIQRDAIQSIGPLIVKASIWTVVVMMYNHGISKLYLTPQWTLSEILYCLIAAIVLDFIHDGWFYWTHRLLHYKPIYNSVHHLHHRSRVPSAFTGYSFHIIEALIVFANEIFICFLIPMDLRFHRGYHLLTTLLHQGGHSGYEMSPCIPVVINGLLRLVLPENSWRRWAQRWIIRVQHHDMHHTHVIYHFSLYFTHWDRIGQTVHPLYDTLI